MHAASAKFFAALRSGAQVVTTIDVARRGQIIKADIPWARPSTVTVDETAAAWRTCSISVVDFDHDLLPKTPLDALAPYGTDLVIRMGYRYPGGAVEQVGLGVFRLTTTRPLRKGPITIAGYDYSRVVARARFEVPEVFAKGTANAGVIRKLVGDRVPFATYLITDNGSTVPLTIFEEGERYGSPWKACMEVAEAAGQQVLFGPDGPAPQLILRPAPSLYAPSVWSFTRGQGSTLIDMQPDLDSSEAYNVYVATGESADLASAGAGPVRGSAEITDPSSPVNPAVFGRAPIFFASPFLRTNAQCIAVAQANLPLKAGGAQGLTITAFPNPAHDAGDVVYAQDDALGIDDLVVLSRFTIDLSGQDPSAYATRSRRIV